MKMLRSTIPVIDTVPPLASLWRRIAAFLLDAGLGMTCALALTFALSVPYGKPGLYSAIAISAALWWLYSSRMESSKSQATLGGRLFGLRVVTLDGGRVSFWRASARQSVGTGLMLAGILTATLAPKAMPFVVIALTSVAFVMAAFTPRQQALGDIAARTAVTVR